MSLKVITTVGTSLFTNYQKPENSRKLGNQFQSIGDLLDKLEKSGAIDVQKSQYKSTIRNLKERIKLIWLPEAKLNSCAEIQTLAAIAKEATSKIEVILLATDTVLSVVAAELIKEWLDTNAEISTKCTFNDNLSAPDTTIVKDLQIKDADKFTNEGFQNLLAIIKKHAVKDKNSEENNVFLNISGGYKALIPFLTLLAQLEKIPLKYMYEDSDQLITVGNLPFSFDFSFLTDEYLAFEMINPKKEKHNLPSISDFIENLSSVDEFKNLKDAFMIIEEAGKVDLSLLGTMLYNKYEESEKENDFNSSNLLGKIMEVKVYEFFKTQFNNATIVLGQPIGESVKGDAYDLDVFVETSDEIWGIEVKPQNVDVLTSDKMSEKKKKKTLEYKCEVGAFHSAKAHFKEKTLHLLIIMYHHKEPHKTQVDNFKSLKKKYDYIKWLWLKPSSNYKGNVNWSVGLNNLKEFNFETCQWVNFEI